jgi:D-alanyl-D-alanine carboxypeptidase
MFASRRTVLRSAVGAAAVMGAGFLSAAPAQAKAKSTSFLRNARRSGRNVVTHKLSPNGWPINTGVDIGGGVWARPVPGAGFDVDVSIGDVEVILVHVARRFHYEVDTLGPGEVIGFKRAKGLARQELNHASGTAIDIRPRFYPIGASGGFFPHQVEVIRDILADCEGLVRWGGDFRTPDEAHFQIDAPPADERIAATAAKLRAWNFTPGMGAGVIFNPADSHRKAVAQALEKRQNA